MQLTKQEVAYLANTLAPAKSQAGKMLHARCCAWLAKARKEEEARQARHDQMAGIVLSKKGDVLSESDRKLVDNFLTTKAPQQLPPARAGGASGGKGPDLPDDPMAALKALGLS